MNKVSTNTEYKVPNEFIYLFIFKKLTRPPPSFLFAYTVKVFEKNILELPVFRIWQPGDKPLISQHVAKKSCWLILTSVRVWCIPALYSADECFFRKRLTRTSLQKHVRTVNKMMQTMGVLCLHLHILNPLPLMTLVRIVWFTSQVLFLHLLSRNDYIHLLE